MQSSYASSAKLRENTYTIVESTTHSLAVNVVLQDRSSIVTLFVNNSNGAFIERSKDTKRYVDDDGADGAGLANVVSNTKNVKGEGHGSSRR